MSNIPINSGTGPGVAVDPVGSDNYQVVKIMQAGSGSTAALSSALLITGTATIIPSGTQTVTGIGLTLAATTASIGAVVSTANASRWNASAINTTSGASVIVKTSGANTIYVTSLMVSVDHACRVDVFSAATTLTSVYLASNGGFALPISENSPLVLTSGQSLTFTPSVSGSASCFALGYTV